jgi:hypothetical protein
VRTLSVKVFANGKQLPVQVGEFSFTRRINLENEVKMTCLCGKIKLKLATHSGLVEKKKPTFIFR